MVDFLRLGVPFSQLGPSFAEQNAFICFRVSESCANPTKHTFLARGRDATHSS